MFIPIATGEFNTKRYRLKSFPNIDLVFIFKMDTLPLKAVIILLFRLFFIISKNEFICFAFQSFVNKLEIKGR